MSADKKIYIGTTQNNIDDILSLRQIKTFAQEEGRLIEVIQVIDKI